MERPTLTDERCQYHEDVYRREVEAARERALARMGGLCPTCGSPFGMQSIYLESLECFPPVYGERFFRHADDPEGCDWLWVPCSTCDPWGLRIGRDFHELSSEDVDAIVAAYSE